VIREADIIVCGSKYIADHCARLGAKAVYLPTPVNEYVARRVRKKTYALSDPPSLVWIGSARTHRADLRFFAEIIKNMAVPLRVTVISEQSQHGLERLLGEAMDRRLVALPFDRWAEPATAYELLTRFDIGVAPALPCEWNRGRSAFKLKQYMAVGLPAVTSPVGEALDLIESGKNAIVADDEHEWTEALMNLLGDTALRQRLGENGARSVLREHGLESYRRRLLALLAELSSEGNQGFLG